MEQAPPSIPRKDLPEHPKDRPPEHPQEGHLPPEHPKEGHLPPEHPKEGPPLSTPKRAPSEHSRRNPSSITTSPGGTRCSIPRTDPYKHPVVGPPKHSSAILLCVPYGQPRSRGGHRFPHDLGSLTQAWQGSGTPAPSLLSLSRSGAADAPEP